MAASSPSFEAWALVVFDNVSDGYSSPQDGLFDYEGAPRLSFSNDRKINVEHQYDNENDVES